jgi:hypothetical protein
MTDFRVFSPPKVPNPTTPVQTITRFNLTINAKTAKALEITILPTMLTPRRSNRMNLAIVAMHQSRHGRKLPRTLLSANHRSVVSAA